MQAFLSKHQKSKQTLPVKVFDSLADEFNFWIEHVNPPRYHKILSFFLPEHINFALDAGCGPGHLSLYLAEHADNVVGVDLSNAMISLAKKHQKEQGKNNISFLILDLNNVPFEPETFDFLGSDCVLHDTPLDTTIPALRDLLKAGGRMFIRDLVTKNPLKTSSPIWQVLWTIKRLPRYVRRFGLQEAMRVIFFEMNPIWVRQRCRSETTTREQFREIYSKHLPGCDFIDYGSKMAAFWKAPT